MYGGGLTLIWLERNTLVYSVEYAFVILTHIYVKVEGFLTKPMLEDLYILTAICIFHTRYIQITVGKMNI